MSFLTSIVNLLNKYSYHNFETIPKYTLIINKEKIEFEKTLENINKNESDKIIPKCDCDASEWTLDEIMAREG